MGECTPCPVDQVPVNHEACAGCAPGLVKVPAEAVKEAECAPAEEASGSSAPEGDGADSGLCTPSPEVCNNKDDDCDGQIDEGLGSISCGLGNCTNTVLACSNGAAQECTPKPFTSREICDGIDNDCDGQVDEGLGSLSCGRGACSNTVPACLWGKQQTCRPRLPRREVCDGIDNDCDGMVDEDLGSITCGRGACSNTVLACVDGRRQVCRSKPPSPEVCDGIDNDCDGKVDDLPAILCKPCNKAIPACAWGQPNSCDGVCPGQQCGEYTTQSGQQAGETACSDAVRSCRVLSHVDSEGGLPTTCFSNAAYTQCMAEGAAYMQGNEDGSCYYYAVDGEFLPGTCSQETFQESADASLDALCRKMAAGDDVILSDPVA